MIFPVFPVKCGPCIKMCDHLVGFKVLRFNSTSLNCRPMEPGLKPDGNLLNELPYKSVGTAGLSA